MEVSAIWLAMAFLVISWGWAALVEKSVSSSVLALWAIAVALILNSGISIG